MRCFGIQLCGIWLLSTIAIGQDRPQQTRVEIGHETTRLTEPLDVDGYIDFVQALDRRMAAGVTPDVNAEVPLAMLLRASHVPKQQRDSYFSRLGSQPADAESPRFVPLEEAVPNAGAKVLDLLRGFAFGEPSPVLTEIDKPNEWVPVATKWVRRNERVLPELVKASKRTRYYSPVVSSNSRAHGIVTPELRGVRLLLEYASGDALVRNQPQQALEYAMTCRRLARLVATGPLYRSYEQARVLEYSGLVIEHACLQTFPPTLAQFRERNREVAAMKKLPSITTVLDIGERYRALSVACSVARGEDVGSLLQFDGAQYASRFEKMMLKNVSRRIMEEDVDVNKVLRATNDCYDRLIAEATQETYPDPDEFYRIKLRRARFRDTFPLLAGVKDADLSGALDDLIAMNVTFEIDWHLFERRDRTQRLLTDVGWALCAFYRENRRWPEQLGDLQPNFVKLLPADPYSGKPFSYRKTQTGCLVYSVGPDGVSNAGDRRDIVLPLYTPTENSQGR